MALSIERDLHMAPGGGESSYTMNSKLQVTLSLSLSLCISFIFQFNHTMLTSLVTCPEQHIPQ
jgi:hypothetical protein